MADYEEIRRRNVAERQAKFAELFKELKEETADLRAYKEKNKRNDYSGDENEENWRPKKKRRRSDYSFTPKFSDTITRTYNTRSRSKRKSDVNERSILDEDSDHHEIKNDIDPELSRRLVPKGRSLKVIFPWAKTFEREMQVSSIDRWDVDKEMAEDNYDDDDDDYDYKLETSKRKSYGIRVTKSEYDPNTIPSPDEITDAMLKNVATKSSKKTYCKYNGTSCHQCRQKTLDTKTVCRSGECIGVRGQFCGPCLRGRYGEDAVTVLKDPNWACPPCRGLCNCSICRTRNGQRPTGILAPIAQEEGFDSVMDYLRATSGDEETEENEEDKENESDDSK